MGELEEKLLEIEELITTSTDSEEFVEPQLKLAVKYLFDNSDSVSQEDMPFVRDLFRRIAAMDKSSSLGYQFYGLLRESSFPFSQEVLREAIDTEPYYNCNDVALESYIAVCLRNSDVPEDVCDNLLQYIPEGHSYVYGYAGILRGISNSRPEAQVKIPDELKDTLISAASRDEFDQTRGKALCAIVYFDISDVVPSLNDRLKRYAQNFDKLNHHILTGITTIATALEYFTGNEEYGQLVDFVEPEMEVGRTTPYPQEFIQTLSKKLEEF
ncbi:hypothetical protein ACFL0W_03625 [Nanoarchaeota archaeon]